MRLRRLAVLVLTLASVTLPAAPHIGVASGHTLAGEITEPVESLEPITPPRRWEPGPGGPLTCCTFG
ncbi:hypothetical protein [Virgisporangium aurantiacum]|uniref:Uncharacterized protein n=1 Tax=Virgisporangium aurantiacum TaxID=175570 RepID=A0A8J3ZA46_9ACTN|nr:hypothetical protein [Virgisporangium aurantiacum]GIJ60002.1 hypothetical protein Vau01_075180 [Virgisporangium aurantiacum]